MNGLANCLQQPGQLDIQLHKSMLEISRPLIKFLIPGLILSAVTKSPGLLAEALVVMVFAGST